MARIISVRLTPKASSDRVGEMRKQSDGGEQLAVYVTAAPDKGKANEALIRLLATYFGLAASRLKIVRGHTSRNKLIEIE
jgi:hypothetical protein